MVEDKLSDTFHTHIILVSMSDEIVDVWEEPMVSVKFDKLGQEKDSLGEVYTDTTVDNDFEV